MPIDQLICEGVRFTLVEETRGWRAHIPRFGWTMYVPTEEDAIDDATRLINAFLLPRMLRADQAA